MNIFITTISVLMVIDAAFTLVNFTKVEPMIHRVFPNLDIKTLATIEGLTGLIIIILKLSTDSLT